MVTGDEEADWIARSRNGEAGAYEALVTKYQRMIHALTFRMTGSLADAEDLAQETFIQAYRQLAKFRGGLRGVRGLRGVTRASWGHVLTFNKSLAGAGRGR